MASQQPREVIALACTLGVVLWDTLSTTAREWRSLRWEKWTKKKLIYFSSRYWLPISLSFQITILAGRWVTNDICAKVAQALPTSTALSMILTGALLACRVFELSRQSEVLGFILASVIALDAAVLAFCITQFEPLIFEVDNITAKGFCYSVASNKYVKHAFFDTWSLLVLAFLSYILVRLVQYARAKHQTFRPRLFCFIDEGGHFYVLMFVGACIKLFGTLFVKSRLEPQVAGNIVAAWFELLLAHQNLFIKPTPIPSQSNSTRHDAPPPPLTLATIHHPLGPRLVTPPPPQSLRRRIHHHVRSLSTWLSFRSGSESAPQNSIDLYGGAGHQRGSGLIGRSESGNNPDGSVELATLSSIQLSAYPVAGTYQPDGRRNDWDHERLQEIMGMDESITADEIQEVETKEKATLKVWEWRERTRSRPESLAFRWKDEEAQNGI